MFDRRRWLARLSFSFFIIAGLLLLQAYKARAQSPPPPQWLMVMYVVGAALSLVLGIAGIRARHHEIQDHQARRNDDQDR